jgi:hypothetical protein
MHLYFPKIPMLESHNNILVSSYLQGLCETSRSHSGEYEDGSFLGYSAM